MHSYCPAEHLNWRYRGLRLMNELRQYDADIYCLQEVESAVFERELKPMFRKLGFDGVYQAHGMGRPRAGVSLFFRWSLFEPLAAKCVNFKDCVSGQEPGRCMFECSPAFDVWL